MSTPVWYEVSTSCSGELVTWLGFNGVDPRDVSYPADVLVGTDDGAGWWIEHAAYARTASGSIMCDPVVKHPVYERRRVPLEFDPPMRWLKPVAPSANPLEVVAEGAGGSLAGTENNVAEGACNLD